MLHNVEYSALYIDLRTAYCHILFRIEGTKFCIQNTTTIWKLPLISEIIVFVYTIQYFYLFRPANPYNSKSITTQNLQRQFCDMRLMYFSE